MYFDYYNIKLENFLYGICLDKMVGSSDRGRRGQAMIKALLDLWDDCHIIVVELQTIHEKLWKGNNGPILLAVIWKTCSLYHPCMGLTVEALTVSHLASGWGSHCQP